MEWSRWLIGTTEREETCRFCCATIKSGAIIVIDELTMEPECILCHWERIRALVRKAKPKPKPKGDRAMPWKKVGGGGGGEERQDLQPISNWTGGTSLEGKILRRWTIKVDDKEKLLFEIDDEARGRLVFSVPVRLGWALENIEDGDRVKIECLGKVKAPGVANKVWDFAVFRDE